MSVNFTDKEQNSISLMNVSYYDSKADYMKSCTPLDVAYSDKEALTDWVYMIESGFIQDITCGTYNGAIDKFTPWQLNNENILDTILNALHEDDFYNTGFFGNCTEEEAEEFEEWSNADWIREYTEVYEVFIIGNNIYVNQD